MSEPSSRRSRVLGGLTADDIVYGVVGLILLISSITKVLGAGAAPLNVLTLVAAALLVGNVSRGWSQTP